MVVDQRIAADGGVHTSSMETRGDEVWLVGDGLEARLPDTVMAAVMRRYGRPIADEALPGMAPDGVRFASGELRTLRFRAAVDADGRDYLAWLAPGAEPICAIATTVVAALRHLVAHR